MHDHDEPKTDGDTVPNDDFGALALIAGLSGLTERQMELLAIITDPANNDGMIDGETRMALVDEYATFDGYAGFDTHAEAETVAGFLRNHSHAAGTEPVFGFGWECNLDGEIGGFHILARLDQADWADRLALVSLHSIDEICTDTTATGLAAALSIAEALDDRFRALATKAQRRALLTSPANVTAAAVHALAAYDALTTNAVDADTVQDLRDALAAMLAAQTITTTDSTRAGS